MKNQKSHDKLVSIIEKEFLRSGFIVRKEVGLANGAGAADIVVYHWDKTLACCEVKSSPSSINQKGIITQMKKYQKEIQSRDYLLISPGAKGIIVQKFGSGEKLNLADYIGSLSCI